MGGDRQLEQCSFCSDALPICGGKERLELENMHIYSSDIREVLQAELPLHVKKGRLGGGKPDTKSSECKRIRNSDCLSVFSSTSSMTESAQSYGMHRFCRAEVETTGARKESTPGCSCGPAGLFRLSDQLSQTSYNSRL